MSEPTPRFVEDWRELVLFLSAEALDFALTHVIARGDTDIFPPAFEFNAIFHDWTNLRAKLETTDLDKWTVGPHRTCLVPKRGLGLRPATQLDPIDTLLITAAVYEAGGDLETYRVPVADDIVHSYRFSPTPAGQIWDPNFTFESFRARSLELAKENEGVVLLTDIADFFTRIYSHRLENALSLATTKADHARVINKLLNAWNQSVSYGVPIGPSVFRLLAEVTIHDVDETLRSEGYTFCRFSDDYRIFVEDERSARRACAVLANALFQHHGLTLQESKTEILSSGDFIERFERSEEDAERAALNESFERFRAELAEQADEADATTVEDEGEEGEVEAWMFDLSEYTTIQYEDLDAEQQAFVDSLNLWQIIKTEVEADRPVDFPLARFALNRIAELRLKGDYSLLLENLKRLYAVFPQVVRVLAAQGDADEADRVAIGEKLLGLIDNEFVGHLEFHRQWVLHVFSSNAAWNHKALLVQLYEKYGADLFTRPELVFALGVGGTSYWFGARKHSLANLPPWERRAFLAGATALAKDEVKHWYASVLPQLNPLEKLVVTWSKSRL